MNNLMRKFFRRKGNTSEAVAFSDLEALLKRKTLKVEQILSPVRGQVVLVTGGGGSIGSELCRQLAGQDPKQLLILDICENNVFQLEHELGVSFPSLSATVLIASVRDSGRMREIFEQYRPRFVFHAAAHKHVPLMEKNPGEAIKNNIFGTKNVLECAQTFGAEKCILISTDKAVNPVSVMGASKRICEMMVQAYAETSETVFSAVRFGNVFGSSGSVIPLFLHQIASGGPVTVTHREATRFFMTTQEAVYLVLLAANLSAGGEIFALDMGEPVRIYELAETLIKRSGYVPGRDIVIEETGLRPGERLEETLMMAEEGLRTTRHEKIFITQPASVDRALLEEGLSYLKEAVLHSDEKALKQTLLRLAAGEPFEEF